MILTCPGCNKKLNISEGVTRKNVRCSACKTVMALPDRPGPEGPTPRQEIPRPEGAELPEPSRVIAVTPDIALMRCAKCKAHAVQRLHANRFSHHPGYVCTSCGAKMRRPGTTSFNIFAILLGAFALSFGFFIAVIAFTAKDAEEVFGELLAGALLLAVLSVAVAGWAGSQLLLPVPLDAPKPPSRVLPALGIMLAVIVLGLLLIGGCLFGAMYWMHEGM